MQKIIAIIILGVGLILVFWGFGVSAAFDDRPAKVFAGSPTDGPMWIMVAGVALSLVGAVAWYRSRRIK